jgi:DNA-directed RNA polymerase specialized sigma24 family protein
VVREAWLRLSRQGTATIHNLAGWLTTVVGRISLDVLRSRQARPEASYDDRLPELVVTADDGAVPEDDVALADSVGLALLVVLDSLGPSDPRLADGSSERRSRPSWRPLAAATSRGCCACSTPR